MDPVPRGEWCVCLPGFVVGVGGLGNGQGEDGKGGERVYPPKVC